jgi:hypothetical protein
MENKPISPSDLLGRLMNLCQRYEDDPYFFGEMAEELIFQVMRELGYGEAIDYLESHR